MRLHDYQANDTHECVRYLTGGTSCVLAYSVGCGKTPVSMTVGSMLLANGTVTHVVVLVPSVGIEYQFWSFYDTTPEVAVADRTVRIAKIKASKDFNKPGRPMVKEGSRNQLVGYFSEPSPGHILVTSYTAARGPQGSSGPMGVRWRDIWDSLVKDAKRTGAKDWSKVLIIVDEGHHDPRYLGDDRATVLENYPLLARITDAHRQEGGLILKLTGTPYRREGWSVVGDDHVISRTLVDQMLARPALAPRTLRSETITVRGADTIDEGDPTAEAGTYGAPAETDEIRGFDMMAEHMVSHGRPKALVRIKHGSKGDNERRVARLGEALDRAGITYVVAYGDGDLDPSSGKRTLKPFNDLIAFENGRGSKKYTDSALKAADVVIAVFRAGEGINIPSRSHVYFWGIPYAMGTFEQVLGRGMRLRFLVRDGVVTYEPAIEDYPERWLDETVVVLCVGDIPKLSERHAKYMLQVSAYLASYRGLPLLGSVIKFRKPSVDRVPKSPAASSMAAIVADPSMEQTWRFFKAWWDSRGPGQSPYDEPAPHPNTVYVIFEEWLAAGMMKGVLAADDHQKFLALTPEYRRRQLTWLAGRENPVTNAIIQNMMQGAYDSQEKCDEAFRAALDVVYNTLCETQAQFMDLPDSLLFTGAQIQEYADQVIRELESESRPTSVEAILQRVENYKAANKGSYPKLATPDPAYPVCTFRRYHQMMTDGVYDLPASRGGLVERLITEDWRNDLRKTAAQLLRSESATASSNVYRRKLPEKAAREDCQHVPVMVYFPQAWKAVAYEGPGLSLDDLTPEQADALGRFPKKSEAKVQQWVAARGIEAFKDRLDEGVFNLDED